MKLKLGALSPSISEQLKTYGFDSGDLKLFDRMNDAITFLFTHMLITETEREKARKRMIALIERRFRKKVEIGKEQE